MVCIKPSNVILGASKVLMIKGNMCVPWVGNLIQGLHVEAYGSQYSTHSGTIEMYHNLRQLY